MQLSSISLAITSLKGALFSPGSIFTTGVNGAWYDPSDFSTMFQDAAGTTPVTAVGQPVGRILDKSGQGNHAFNPSGNSANFPVLQQDGTGLYHLLFNGVNQWLQSIGNIDLRYGDKMFAAAGITKLSDATAGQVFEFGNASAGTFRLLAPYSNGAAAYQFRSRGNTEVACTKLGIAAPNTSVVGGVADISLPIATLRVNGVDATTVTTSQGTGNYGNYSLYIGARAGTSLFFNGRLYGLVVAGKQASASEIASTESWLNQKTGAY